MGMARWVRQQKKTGKETASMNHFRLTSRHLAGILAGLVTVTTGLPLTAMAQNSAMSAIKASSASEKVPAGTMLNISFLNQMDSKTVQPGAPFMATLSQDFTSGERVLLPKGTLMRGRVQQVTRPGFFSKGGSLSLEFDHLVLPTGEQLPVSLNLSAENANVTKAGTLYTDPGIPTKLERSVDRGVDTFKDIRDKSIKAGKDIAGGLGMLVTVPAGVVGGAVGGTAVTTGKSVVSIIGRGDSVVINPGDTLNVDFGGAFTLPAE
jgi:hypothetical protein